MSRPELDVIAERKADDSAMSGAAPSFSVAVPARARRPLALFTVGGVFAIGLVAAWFSGLLPIDQLPSLLSSKPEAAAAVAARANSAKVANFMPTPEHWRTLGVEAVGEATFQTTLATDGKIAIDEDHTTPAFAPYAGRILKLFVKPGDHIEAGQPLFVVEASDMVQGQNDFLAAKANVTKARSQLDVAAIVLRRHRELIQAAAVAKRELEQAEVAHVAAENDLKAAEVALEAARNRLRILGKTDAEISAFEEGKRRISAETTVMAPLSGTIVQRKVGPGQYVSNSSSDPVFVIGDLSTVWLIANVRETDATRVKVGQPLEFRILAEPDKVYRTAVSYISASVNPDTRRLQVRAEIKNPERSLRPEMFANVTIIIGSDERSASIPRSAVIYEGEAARVWAVRPDKSIELRRITPGILRGNQIQVVAGLKPGEQIVVRGSLFIDRLAAPDND